MKEVIVNSNTVDKFVSFLPEIRKKGIASFEYQEWSKLLDELFLRHYGRYSNNYVKVHDLLYYTPFVIPNEYELNFKMSFEERLDKIEEELLSLKKSIVFSESLLHQESDDTNIDYISAFVSTAQKGDVEGMMAFLDDFFSQGNYQVIDNTEKYFQSTINTISMLVGLSTEVEHHTTDGRIDQIIKTEKYIYIIEYKVDQTAEIALQQIFDKEYDKPFRREKRKIYKVGVNFSSNKRRIDNWKILE